MTDTAEFVAAQTAAPRLGAASVVSLDGVTETLDGAPSGAGPTAAWLWNRHGWAGVLLLASLVAACAFFLWSARSGASLESPQSRTQALLEQQRRAVRAVLAEEPPVEQPAPEALAPEFKLRDLNPSQAQIFNAMIPVSRSPNPPANPFVLNARTDQDELRAVDCLAAAVYYEAASEPMEGQQAVAQVVLNRMRDPAYPKTICGVVFQGSQLPTGWQFSFTGDGSLSRRPSATGWANAVRVATAALNGFVARRVGQATHYHTVWVAPYWSPRLAKIGNIGAHIFYRWLGTRGLPGASTGVHAGSEPFVSQIAALDPRVTDHPTETSLAVASSRHTPASSDAAQDAQAVVRVAVNTAPPELVVSRATDLLPTVAVTAAATLPPAPVLNQDVHPRTNARLPIGSSW